MSQKSQSMTRRRFSGLVGSALAGPIPLRGASKKKNVLCRLEPPKNLEGASLRPLLRNPGSDWSRPAYSQVHRGQVRGYTVRTQRWRYTEWDEGRAGSELYDYQSDPGELRNLASSTDHQEVCAGMRLRLRALRRG